MKLDIIFSNRFKKDLKILARRGCNFTLLEYVTEKLAAGEALEEKYRDHALTGDYAGFRECHITPDWLLIYRTDEDALILFLSRSGTHSDLF